MDVYERLVTRLLRVGTAKATFAADATATDVPVPGRLSIAMRGPSGEVFGALSAVDDDADRVWSADDLAALRDVAAAAADGIARRICEQRRAEFAADASHELRTPLTALRFELDDLAHSADVAAAVAHVDALALVVDGLVAQARAGAGRDDTVDLYEMCRDAAEVLGPVAVDGASMNVRGSRGLLRRIVNLLLHEADAVRVVADGGFGRLQVLPPHHLDPDTLATVHRLARTAGGRLLTQPAPDVAYELVVPRLS